jgi:hypothetical protein
MEQNQIELPISFAVQQINRGRNGYNLLRWSVGENHIYMDQVHRVHILKSIPHQSRFYVIQTVIPTQQPTNRIFVKKRNGTLNYRIKWKFTNESLEYDGMHFPVLKITPRSNLPSLRADHFIPTDNNDQVVPIVNEDPLIVLPYIPKQTYVISKIPQHTIRALLRDAAMEEETCPITSLDIDVTNGAITSCFHLFEKDAINKWLSNPNSNDRCPVCNTACNMYTLDN